MNVLWSRVLPIAFLLGAVGCESLWQGQRVDTSPGCSGAVLSCIANPASCPGDREKSLQLARAICKDLPLPDAAVPADLRDPVDLGAPRDGGMGDSGLWPG